MDIPLRRGLGGGAADDRGADFLLCHCAGQYHPDDEYVGNERLRGASENAQNMEAVADHGRVRACRGRLRRRLYRI